MAFTTFRFLLFFAVTVGAYSLFPREKRWICLLLASLGFYLMAGVRCLAYLLFTALTVWAAALALQRFAGAQDSPQAERRAAWIIAACIAANLGILAVLKYLGFALRVLQAVSGGRLRMTPPSLLLPLGISFYTFQSIGYLLDVHRGVVAAEKNPLRVLLFLCFFPCIAQGPINRYGELAPQLAAGGTTENFGRGMQRMLWGFFEKLVVADRLGLLVDGVFSDLAAHAPWQLALAIVLYAFQIYADFQGYMDIACGCGEMIGITLPENFRSPYLSATVPEFWRRWHITLGAWFRDYVYYPVMRSPLFGRIREKTFRTPWARPADRILTVIALLVVWSLTGLWHGAGASYVLWGLYHGVLISLSTLFAPVLKKRKLPARLRGVQILRTFVLVLIGYVFFRAQSLQTAGLFFRTLLGGGGRSAELALGTPDLWAAGFGLAVLIAVDVLHGRGRALRADVAQWALPLRWLLWLALLCVIVLFGVYGPGYDASSFLYFKY